MSADEPARRPARPSRGDSVRVALKMAGVFCLYLALSYASLAPGAAWRTRVIGGAGDAMQFVWFLAWWPFAIAHQLNPFISKLIWAPAGFNMTWATAVPFAALAMAPVTAIGGAVLSYNLLTLLAPPLAAFTAFLLARSLTRDWLGAAIGGFLFGFSSYEWGQRLGHLHADFDALIPLIGWICLLRFRRAISARIFVPAMAAALLAELGLSTELLATAGLFGAITWLVFWLHAGEPDRRLLRGLALECLGAFLCMTVLAAPFLVYLVKGLPDVPHAINEPGWYATDFLNFFVPTPVTALGGAWAQPLAARFPGSTAEQGGYLGLPLIAIMAAYFHGVARRPYGRAFLAVTILIALASLGPVLRVAGHTTGIPMPWLIADQLPVLVNALPSRLSMYLALAAGLAASLWINAGVRRGARMGAGLLACACIFPAPGMPGWGTWPAVPFFSPGHIRSAFGDHATLFIVPFGADGPAIGWQYDAGFAFAQAGGHAGFIPARETKWRILQDLENARPGPDFAAGLAAYCDTHHVNAVIAGPGAPPVIAAAIASLGWKSHEDSGVLVIIPPDSARLSYRYVMGDVWPAAAGPGWMGRQVEIITHNAPSLLTLSGQDRPAGLAETITLAGGGRSQQIAFGRGTLKSVNLPADSELTITAGTLFRPHDYFPTADRRHVSVTLTLRPAA
jgi:hypothetical protein